MQSDTGLTALHDDFVATSTQSMPLAGIIFWTVVAIASRLLSPAQVAYLVGFGSGAIFPLALLMDRLRGRNTMKAGHDNPLLGMFLQNLVMVALLWPFVILAAMVGRSPNLVVLGGAILMAIVWIPYGWAAHDRVGMQHAVARCVLCYAAFIYFPPATRVTAIAIVVLLCYAYSLCGCGAPSALLPGGAEQATGIGVFEQPQRAVVDVEIGVRPAAQRNWA